MPQIKLYPYQQKYFLDKSRYKAAMFSRQSGKTFTSCLEIVDDCFSNLVMGKPCRWVILSSGERQAQEALQNNIVKQAKLFGLAVDLNGYDWKAQGGPSFRAQEVKLSDNVRITALPANPETARGFSANLLLDEFAFHKDADKIFRAAFPITTRGYKMRVISTPNGKGNKFYDIMTSKGKNWSRHVVDVYQAVKDGLDIDIEQLKAVVNDADTWAQEYELQWQDEASSWLSYDLIYGVEDKQAGKPDNYEGNPCFIGRDIGLRKDLHVIWVWEKIGDVLWCREILTQKRTSFKEQAAAFDDVMRRYDVARACIDQTGMGENVVEYAKDKYGDTIEGVLFNSGSKLIMANQGKAAFEDKTVRIPEGDSDLRADLHKIKKVNSSTGTPRFIAERDKDHADRTWAAFLGIHAATEPAQEYGYQAVTNDGEDGADGFGNFSDDFAFSRGIF